MANNKYIIWILLLLLTINISITGCEKKSNVHKNDTEEITHLSFWFPEYDDTKILNKHKGFVKEFNKKNNDIQVNIVQKKTRERLISYDQILSAVEAGNGPDITILSDIPYAVDMGIVQDISDLIENDKDFDLSQYYLSSLEQCKYKSKYYSLPFNSSVSSILIYNTDMFLKAGLDPELPPRTINEFDSYVEKLFIEGEDGYYKQIGFDMWQSEFLNYYAALELFTNKSVMDIIMLDVTDADIIQAFNWVRNFANKYGYEKTNKSIQKLDAGYFGVGKGVVAMQLGNSQTIGIMTNWNTPVKWAAAKFPTAFEDKSIDKVFSYKMGIINGCKNREAAYEFLKFYCGKEGQLLQVTNQKDMYSWFGYSSIKQVNESIRDSMHPAEQFIINSILPAAQTYDFNSMDYKEKYEQYSENYTQHYNSNMSTIYQGALSGEGDINEKLKALQDELNRITKFK